MPSGLRPPARSPGTPEELGRHEQRKRPITPADIEHRRMIERNRAFHRAEQARRHTATPATPAKKDWNPYRRLARDLDRKR